MKGLVFKLIIVLSLVLGAINYSTYLATGKSLFTTWGFNLPALPILGDIQATDINLPNISLPNFNIPSVTDFTRKNDVPVKVYKWVDENGTINYTQEKPNAAIVQAARVKELVVDPNVNVVDFNNVVDFSNNVQTGKLSVAEAELESIPEIKPEKINPVNHQASSILPNPHNAKKLIEEAKSVQALMDARIKTLNAEMN